MGDWAVLKYWNESGDGFHEWHESEHANTPAAIMWRYKCWPVVEEHQATPEVKAPEFTISVSYQTPRVAALRGGFEASKPGWKWSICWTNRDGNRKMCSGYGLQTPDQAKNAAELKADAIALSELPEEVYPYTPEI